MDRMDRMDFMDFMDKHGQESNDLRFAANGNDKFGH